MAPDSRASILVLEDHDDFRRFVVRALTEAGYSVVDTGNADEAVMLLDGAAVVDLLIADIKIPLFQRHGMARSKRAIGETNPNRQRLVAKTNRPARTTTSMFGGSTARNAISNTARMALIFITANAHGVGVAQPVQLDLKTA